MDAVTTRPDELADDRVLVAAFLTRRDDRTFREIYRRHTPALYGLAQRMLGGPGRGADDAVQETWMRAAAALERFRWESSLRTWLTGIVIRCCRETVRARRGEALSSVIEGLEEAVATGAPPSGERAAPSTIDLERAVARLPDGYREVLVLHDIEGYTHEEIATLLEINDGTSKSQLSKARRQLRALLGTTGEKHDDSAR